MKYTRPLKVVLLLAITVLSGQAQSSLSVARVSGTTRDSEAINVLQAALSALSLGNRVAISDYRLKGAVTQWDGQEISGVFSQVGVGAADRRTQIRIADNPIFGLLVLNDAGTLRMANDSAPRYVPNEIAMEASNYFFINLLEEALSNQRVGLMLVSSPNDPPDTIGVRITRHIVAWRPAMGTLGTAQFDVYIDRNSKTVTQINSSARLESNLSRRIPHAIHFSDYRQENGWLLPHVSFGRSYDWAGRLQSIDSSLSGPTLPANLFTVGSYWPFGAIQTMTLGPMSM
jgi:hypothetical protein